MSYAVSILVAFLAGIAILAIDHRAPADDPSIALANGGVAVRWTVLRQECDFEVYPWFASGDRLVTLAAADVPAFSFLAIPWPVEVHVALPPTPAPTVLGATIAAVCNPVQALLPVKWRPLVLVPPYEPDR